MTSTLEPATSGEGADAPEKAKLVVGRLREQFEHGRTRPLEWRLAQLHGLSRLLEEQETELLDAMAADLGRPGFEGWLADLRTTGREVEYAVKHLHRWVADEKVRPPWQLRGTHPSIIREPLGVVLVIAPWNYPVYLCLAPMVGALAAGNAVVLKPSELAPTVSSLLARLIPHYLDPKAVAVVEGGVAETQALLAERFDHIFYTGNGRVGREVMAAAARHLTPVTLELGGKSPTIVDRDCDLDMAAGRIVFGKMINAGQTCVAPDYVLVHRDVERELLDKLAAVVRTRYGDDPAASPDFGRIVNDRHLERLAGLLEGGGYESVVCGGKVDHASRYVAPTVLAGVSLDAPVMTEEIFGPILPVVAVDSVDEAIEIVNSRDKPLALYVFTRSKITADRVLRSTSSGGACINDAATHLLVEALPFGGVGPSGMGAYHGRWGFETFSHRKAVLDRPAWLELPIAAPYTKWKQRLFRRLL